MNNSVVTQVPGNILGTALLPFQRVFALIDGSFRDGLFYFTDINSVKQENEMLKAKIDEVEKLNKELNDNKQKIAELRDALNIKDRYNQYDIAGANIIAKDPGNWFDIFTLDIGSKDGVEENTPVVTGKGLVGRVIKTDLFSCKVLSIIDPDSSVSARISKTRDLVVIRGDIDLKELGECRMDYIPNDVDIVEGDIVETSGLGGIFPKDIVIGKIKNIRISDNEFTKYAQIVPVVDFKRLEEVYLLRRKK
jgi:rod shape-determining protein MreC